MLQLPLPPLIQLQLSTDTHPYHDKQINILIPYRHVLQSTRYPSDNTEKLIVARDVPEFRPDFKKVPVPVGIIIGSGRNKILLKTALFPNCFKLFHKLKQLTKTISDYGEEINVFRQFLEEVCFFFLHICFRIQRTAFLKKQITEVMIQSKKHVT